MNTGRVADLGTTFPYAMPNYSNDCGGSGPTPIEPSPSVAVDRSGGPPVDWLATGAYMAMRAADGIAQPFWTDTDSGAIVSAFISERSNYLAPTQIFGSAAATTVAQAGDGVAGVVTGDFNGDGKLDLAVPSTKNGSGVVSVYLGNGDGALTAGQTITLEALP